VIASWARILLRTPGSRLIMKAKGLRDAGTRERYENLFRQEGIEPERITLRGQLPSPADHLSLYNQIDIALDSFPYNGTTTTFEALWMGVPVVAMAGDWHAGRVGHSILSCLGLERLVASDTAGYEALACSLAADRDSLTHLRKGMRERLAGTPLLDDAGFTARLERAYRTMWRERIAARDAPRSTMRSGGLRLPKSGDHS
jgi:predicted O-linked N-acetylglucosamine transferase (SPINDLY family)